LADAVHRFFEGQLQLQLQIGAARTAGTASTRAAAAAERAAAHAEDVAEDVAEVREDVTHVGETFEAGLTWPFVAVPIIERPLVGMTEHFVSFRGFFEAILGCLIVWIAVGVEIERQLAVGFFDLVGGSGLGNPKDFVIVPLSWHARAARSLASSG